MAGSDLVSVSAHPMTAGDETYVRTLFALCHPDAEQHPTHWYFAHPTLVLPLAHRLAGFTSFTLSPDAKRGYVCYGVDLCVHPEDRGRGYGHALHAERCRIAQELGAIDFVGTVEPGNAAMIRILTAAGCRHISSGVGRDFYIGRL